MTYKGNSFSWPKLYMLRLHHGVSPFLVLSMMHNKKVKCYKKSLLNISDWQFQDFIERILVIEHFQVLSNIIEKFALVQGKHCYFFFNAGFFYGCIIFVEASFEFWQQF